MQLFSELQIDSNRFDWPQWEHDMCLKPKLLMFTDQTKYCTSGRDITFVFAISEQIHQHVLLSCKTAEM